MLFDVLAHFEGGSVVFCEGLIDFDRFFWIGVEVAGAGPDHGVSCAYIEFCIFDIGADGCDLYSSWSIGEIIVRLCVLVIDVVFVM